MPEGKPDLTALGQRVLGDAPKSVADAAAALGETEDGFVLLWMALLHRPHNARALIGPLKEAPVDLLVAAAAQSLTAASPEARVAIVHVLSAVDDPHASELIAGALEDVSVAVRIAALRSLAARGQAVPTAVVRCRADASTEVRLAAVEVLADLRTGVAVDHLIHYVDHLIYYAADPAPEVRSAARAALGERRAEEVARAAMRALRDPLVRRAGVAVLGDLGAAGAPMIVAELAEAPEELRADLEEALRIGGGVDRSRQDLRHPSASIRGDAVYLLELLGAADAVADLIEALADPSPAVRVNVIGALSVLDSKRISLARLKEVFVSDPDLDVVAAAEKTLRSFEGEDT